MKRAMSVLKLGILLKKNTTCVKITRYFCKCNVKTLEKVFQMSKRQFSDVKIPERFRKKLPFEQESETVARNTLLYSCYDTKRTSIYISAGGTFLSLVLLQSADLIYRYSGAVKFKPPDDAPWYMWWMKVNYSSEILKYTMISIMLIAGE